MPASLAPCCAAPAHWCGWPGRNPLWEASATLHCPHARIHRPSTSPAHCALCSCSRLQVTPFPGPHSTKAFAPPPCLAPTPQLFSAAAGLGLSACGLQHVRPAPSARDFLLRLSPTILATAATMYFGNAAYLVGGVRVDGVRGRQGRRVRAPSSLAWTS